jgi:hypothetical protein
MHEKSGSLYLAQTIYNGKITMESAVCRNYNDRIAS